VSTVNLPSKLGALISSYGRLLDMPSDEDDSMRGKVVLITGSTSGLGLHATKAFYKRGATVLLTCRDHVRGRSAIEAVKGVSKNDSDPTAGGEAERIHLFEVELTDYQSLLVFTQEVTKTVQKIDVVICNAGVMGLPFEVSREGVERHFHTNHLSHFVMINQLLPLLSASPSARVLVVTSGLYKGADRLPSLKQLMAETTWDYESRKAYAISKLANCLYTKALARRLEAKLPTVSVYAIRPGFVRGTELGRETHWLLRKVAAPLIWMVSRSLDQGIAGYIHCATAPKDELKSGGLFFDAKEEQYEETVTDEESEHLWRLSLEMEEIIVRRRETLSDEERRLFQEGRQRLSP
ncbi:hypothetical protein PENTCL1PPCAC_21883, partial [Pristionchus entomophagus]